MASSSRPVCFGTAGLLALSSRSLSFPRTAFPSGHRELGALWSERSCTAVGPTVGGTLQQYLESPLCPKNCVKCLTPRLTLATGGMWEGGNPGSQWFPASVCTHEQLPPTHWVVDLFLLHLPAGTPVVPGPKSKKSQTPTQLLLSSL